MNLFIFISAAKILWILVDPHMLKLKNKNKKIKKIFAINENKLFYFFLGINYTMLKLDYSGLLHIDQNEF